jgi:hypothetical protein
MQTFAQQSPAVATRHVRFGARFVQEDQASKIDARRAGLPLLALLEDIGPILLGRPQRLFLKENPSFFRARHTAMMLQFTFNSATHHWRSCSSVASG